MSIRLILDELAGKRNNKYFNSGGVSCQKKRLRNW